MVRGEPFRAMPNFGIEYQARPDPSNAEGEKKVFGRRRLSKDLSARSSRVGEIRVRLNQYNNSMNVLIEIGPRF